MNELPLFLGATAGWALLVVFFWRSGAWLLYYVLAAAGSAVLFALAGHEFLPLEQWFRDGTAGTVHHLSSLYGVRTAAGGVEHGSLLVAGGAGGAEWTHLTVGIESSGLLESAALLGLVGFFPAQALTRRFAMVAAALAMTFVINIVRVSIIVGLVAYLGQDALEVAHVVIGRLVFFVLAIALYWYVITRPTLRTVGLRLQGRGP